MSERRVLFIVEGARAEPRFLDRMHQILFGTKVENIYHYGTVIYDLLERMFPEGEFDDGLDIVSVLREKEGEREQRAILENEFTDVYLVFDMDPHHQKYDGDLLAKAMGFFDDSTQNGKLYLNYPMLESFKHLKEHNEFGYLERTVKVDKETLGEYKRTVDAECHSDFKQLEKYTEETFAEIIRMNLRKASLILRDSPSLPSEEIYLQWSGEDILFEQRRKMDSDGEIFVINTSSFIPVDYSPSRFCAAE